LLSYRLGLVEVHRIQLTTDLTDIDVAKKQHEACVTDN
jgi:hypothetical protein